MAVVNNSNNGEQAVGLLLSIFYGIIVASLVTHFSDIVIVLSKQKPPLQTSGTLIFVSWVAAILYSLNTLRMGHGFVISTYDDRNPTFMGRCPYCPSEMLILVLTLLITYISIKFLSSFWDYEWYALYDDEEKTNCFWLIVLYMAPHFIYPFWDIVLRCSLHNKDRNDDNVKLYKKFVLLWLIIDGIVILSIVLLLVFNGFKNDLPRGLLLGIFAFLHLVIFIIDYLILNKEYYFPSC